MNMNNKTIVRKIILAMLLISCMVIAIAAQESISAIATKQDTSPIENKADWGTSHTSIIQVNAFACPPISSNTSFTFSTAGGDNKLKKYCPTTSGLCVFICDVSLPTGAQIVGFGIYGCDTSTTGEIGVGLLSDLTVLGSISSGDANTDGCTNWQVDLSASPETVDNSMHTYSIQAVLENPDTTTMFSSVSIEYKLQVSPAPSVATFTDVPTSHIFFQYIEALARSGITAGCTSTQYCPNTYVTRGQMAKYLAVALGLSWENTF